jgi:lipoate-protein ligase A
MLFVENEPNNDPRINLAIEEYLIKNIAPQEDILLFYINQPSIIIGRNQITVQEINVDYVEEHGIIVVRRLSGGGAVYHDLGNLNFSFIAPNSPDNFHNFRKFTQPVVDVLGKMGVPAELSGRNDILVDGKKISGNAQYVSGARMVSHGTLLWETNLSRVGAALKAKPAKFEGKGIQSVRSRVANIMTFCREPPGHYGIPPDDHRRRLCGEQVNEYKLLPKTGRKSSNFPVSATTTGNGTTADHQPLRSTARPVIPAERSKPGWMSVKVA